jgi:hypothetical protein
MRGSLPLLLLWIAACEQNSDDRSANLSAAAPGSGLAAPAQASKPPAVVPLPGSQDERDRMILAGYTPHADHLHAPGVDVCPLAKGTEAVM